MARYAFQELIDNINKLARAGVLGSEDKIFFLKSIKDLRHAFSVNDSREIEKLVNKICKGLLKSVF
ncbi:MAG: hypothetical protein CO135_03810 [Candidatus Levybacteria bacterium CG_4_9_14_3_um_filter_35_16]|nr:MAG: hypothetical protein COW87_03135 [Candidatus Levybacteria bacterium CG22_combo_CG10-13_8_21_14_all_35_11]PJA90931.1 MAG: hypothetical protein CO135_03810 [Candidatus Levybacteria bacterium CG_4_9_14_3_um_filter_35_16]PJC54701.1 MAG: hypothetical protein CO028_01045 [Candidatus Levybacteria bacterium CG_4_9_14_0_2_um_filter_35_21]